MPNSRTIDITEGFLKTESIDTTYGDSSILTINGNVTVGGDWLQIPSGTTAERPGTTTSGMIRFNTTTSKLEVNNDGSWNNIIDGTITNDVLTNSSITVAGDSGSDSVALGETLTISGTANEIVTTGTSNTLTIGLPDDVTITGDLTVDTDTLYVDSTNNRVGIGTTSPSDYYSNQLVVYAGAEGGITIAGAGNTQYLSFADGTVGNQMYSGYINYAHGTDKMGFAVQGSSRAWLTTTGLGLGTATPGYKLEVTGDAYVSTDLTVGGNLTVSGTTTTIDTTNTQVTDNLLELNSGATANTNDAGIIIERGSTGDNAIMAWDESADQFIFGTTTATASDTGNLTITASPINVGNITSSGQLYLNDSNPGYLYAYPSGQIYHDVRGTTSIDNSTYVYHELSHPGGSNFTGESLQYSNNGYYTLNGNNATRAFNVGSFGVHLNNRQIYGSGSETVTLSVGTLDLLDFGSGTLTTAVHYDAAATYGGGTSNITNYIGYRTKPLETNASFNVTNAYGFYSDIADDSGAHYNFYAAGTGPNYFNGNVGIGTSSPSNKTHITSSESGTTPVLRVENSNSDGLIGFKRTSGTPSDDYVLGADSTRMYFRNNTTSSDLISILEGGNVGIGTTSPTTPLHVEGNATVTGVVQHGANQIDIYNSDQMYLKAGYAGSNIIFFVGSGTPERMRIKSDRVLVGSTVDLSTTTTGCQMETAGTAKFARSGFFSLVLNRTSNDGEVAIFEQDGTQEGGISISGATTSYNGFTGTHWSRLTDNSKPTILKGTILESLDEMMDWYQVQFDITDDEGNTTTQKESYALGDGESVGDVITYNFEGIDYQATIIQESDVKHTKSKISDTVDAKNVYGVFMAWDNDDDTVNDMYVAQTGTFVVRMNSAETVSKGDLIQSNGDGTGKVQADDIIRASTVAKVLSTTKIETYEDGSYIVPCSLHC